MAITTGAELATAVANWMARADLTARIPEFVALAEAKFNRSLRTLDMETKVTYSITGEYVAKPAGLLEVRTIYLDGAPRRSLQLMDMDTETSSSSTSGRPRYFAVTGDNFRFSPVPDGTYASTLIYYASLTTVSTGGTATNWLLTKHPDVYLYGTLVEAAPYVQDAQLTSQWLAGYTAVMGDLQRADSRNRWGGSGMTVRPA